jgi:hypothetical protein
MKLAYLLAAGLAALPARDLGQWNNAPPEQRAWALAQVVPRGPEKGTSCCNTADGVAAQEDIRGNTYWVTFDADGRQVGPMPVPDERVLEGSRYGPKVWWYKGQNGSIMIRCFAPGAKI